MKDTRSIEEQVAELTEQQIDTILKVDVIAGLVIILGALSGLVLMIINLFAILNISLPFEVADKLVIINFIIMALYIAFVVGTLVFVKIKFPYYSSSKCSYIRKMRKNK